MAGDYAGDGRGQIFVHPHHNHQHADDGCCLYHVPQHSRREKLRFPAEESTAALASSLPLLYPANAASTLANLLPSSYYNVHGADDSGAYHFGAGTALRQIHPQGFSLSLSPAETSSLRTFTVYAAVLNKSGFVEPARQLLEELCQFGRGDFDVCREPPEIFFLEREAEKLTGVGELQWKKIKLVSILDEVYRSYRIYYQQVEAVIASFEAVAGFSTAAPYVSMALKAMSKNFASVKNAISSHLSHLNKEPGKGLGTRESSSFGFLTTGDQACSRRGNQGSVTFGQPHGWRPQRGLPEHAVAVLKAWLFEHFLHPYPTDGDKQMLAKQTGLSRNQVSNWFINARVRLWKPMVEEIHTMELHQLHSSGSGLNTDFQPPPATFSGDQPPPENNSMQRNHSKPPTGMELRNLEEPCNFIFNGYTGNNQPLMDRSVISLTLGLHQNNGTTCLPEAEPVNVTRRFGAEECRNAYVVGGFEGEEMRGYGKEIGGRSVHDFVG